MLDSTALLAGLYSPPLRRFRRPAGKLYERARAAAWGDALHAWLAGFSNEQSRAHYRQAVASLLSFCRKPPWRVRPADAARWLELGLDGKADATRKNLWTNARLFYRFACGKTWTSPSGRCLRLCRSNPLDSVEPPGRAESPRVVPLGQAGLQRLLAAFDRETPFGRRDYALFTLVLETGLPLKQALALRLKDLPPRDEPQPPASNRSDPNNALPAFARRVHAAWQAVRDYLRSAVGLPEPGPDDYIFTSLADLPGQPAEPSSRPGGCPPLHYSVAYRALGQYAAWAGLDPRRVTPQVLRYTGARRLLEEGAGLAELAAFLRLKDLAQLRQVAGRLGADQPPASPCASPQPSGSTEGDSLPSPPLKRRTSGAQPGNTNSLKNAHWAARYKLSRLGIYNNNFAAVELDRIPAILAGLDRMMQEIDDLPEESLLDTVKKLEKLSFLIYSSGRLKAILIRKLREQTS